MWGAILSVIGWLIGKLFGKPAGPSPEVVEGEKLGAATTGETQAVQALKTETAIADAEANSPQTKDETVATLKGDKF